MIERKGPKVAGYVRVSTEEQAREGVSLAAQRERIEAYAAYNHLNLTAVFVDEGVSAGTPLADRPAGRRLIDEITNGGIECVIAFKLDRLFRDAVECLETVRKTWREKGTALRLLDMGGQEVDTKTALGQFFLTVMAAAAEMERNLIKERTKAALDYKAQKGEWRGRVPFGFRINEDGKLVEDEDAQRTIQAIKRSRRRSGTSFRELAQRYGLSVGLIHTIATTDLRTVKRIA